MYEELPMALKNRGITRSLSVIADTGCLAELAGINQLELLKKLYGKILVTPEVKKGYGRKIPEWIEVRKVKNKTLVRKTSEILGPGEASSIALASETPGALLILDSNEGAGFAANNAGLTCTGTAGVIRHAFYRGYIENAEKAKEYFIKVTGQFNDNAMDIENIGLVRTGGN
jgi:predicted nucleic acid-binding protein